LLAQDLHNLAERVTFIERLLRPLKQVGEQSGDRSRCPRNPFLGEILKHLRMGDEARGMFTGCRHARSCTAAGTAFGNQVWRAERVALVVVGPLSGVAATRSCMA